MSTFKVSFPGNKKADVAFKNFEINIRLQINRDFPEKYIKPVTKPKLSLFS